MCRFAPEAEQKTREGGREGGRGVSRTGDWNVKSAAISQMLSHHGLKLLLLLPPSPLSLPPSLPIYPSCCLVRSSLKASSLRRRTSRSRWAERETD